jgi:hypothetical protein
MNEVGIIPPAGKGREHVLQNASPGKQHSELTLDSGDTIVIEDSGATIYDESIANEVRDKVKNDPTLHIYEKEHIKMEQDRKQFRYARWTFPIRKCNHPGCFARPITNYCIEHQEHE